MGNDEKKTRFKLSPELIIVFALCLMAGCNPAELGDGKIMTDEQGRRYWVSPTPSGNYKVVRIADDER